MKDKEVRKRLNELGNEVYEWRSKAYNRLQGLERKAERIEVKHCNECGHLALIYSGNTCLICGSQVKDAVVKRQWD